MGMVFASTPKQSERKAQTDAEVQALQIKLLALQQIVGTMFAQQNATASEEDKDEKK